MDQQKPMESKSEINVLWLKKSLLEEPQNNFPKQRKTRDPKGQTLMVKLLSKMNYEIVPSEQFGNKQEISY